jgi:hypothetical protein
MRYIFKECDHSLGEGMGVDIQCFMRLFVTLGELMKL